MSEPTIKRELDKLAVSVAKEAQAKGATLAHKLDALKYLTAYYAAQIKAKNPKKGDDDDGESDMASNFAAMKRGLRDLDRAEN